jgi:hypothetical protein
MENSLNQFVICIHNKNCDDLILHKVYPVVPDPAAASDGYLRILDESGEDYLYPETCFLFLELPQTIEQALLTEIA